MVLKVIEPKNRICSVCSSSADIIIDKVVPAGCWSIVCLCGRCAGIINELTSTDRKRDYVILK